MKSKSNYWWIMSLLVLVWSCQDEDPIQTNEELTSESIICADCDFPIPDEVTDNPGCPDLTIEAVTFNWRSGNVIHYTVRIKNIGNSTAHIDYDTPKRVGFQSYLFDYGVVPARSVPACGSSFARIDLAPGQTTSQSISCTFPASVNISDFDYLRTTLSVGTAIVECSTGNNSRWTYFPY